MLQKSVLILTAFTACVTLAACGGGGGGPTQVVPTVPEPDPVVTTPDDGGVLGDEDQNDPSSSATDEVPTSLIPIGTVAPVENDLNDILLPATLAALAANQTAITSAAVVTSSDGNRSILTRDGTYVRDGGALTLGDLAVYLNNDVQGEYDHASAFHQDDAVGIVGLATPIGDLRTTGTARFEGGASGFVITGANGIDLTNGRSIVDVDFEDRLVNVTLDEFQAVSQISGFVVDSPVTEIEWRDAGIADAVLFGGSVVLRGHSGSQDITGLDTTMTAQGQFYGLDADGMTPDEVGGVIMSKGTNGMVYGTFIAD